MGRTRKRSTSTSSSGSSSSISNNNYKRCKRSRMLAVVPSQRKSVDTRSEQSTSRSSTPPVSHSGDKVTRLENLVEKLIEHQVVDKPKQPTFFAKPECLPEFHPGNPNMSTAKWIGKIEQLQEINNCDDPTVIYHMQNRLGGLARKWYDNLQSYQRTYQHTWPEWKQLLLETFPDQKVFTSTLKKMLKRYKTTGESWEQYYFEKSELISACDISGKKAVSCLIDGITDRTIQTGARAGRYETPSALYAEYLSTLKSEDYSPPLNRRSIDFRGVTKDKRLPTFAHNSSGKRPRLEPFRSQKISSRCYNCGEVGHLANSCTKQKLQCTKCKRLGHLEANCTRRNIRNNLVEGSPQICDQNYFFDCWVNGTPKQSYVDTGCGAVLLRESDAKSLNITYTPVSASVLGYGGTKVQVLGKANIHLRVDEVDLDVEALVVPDYAQSVAVMVGQSFVNHSDVVMIASKNAVRVLPSSDNIAKFLDVPMRKIPLWAKESTIIPPQTTALVAVTSRGAYDGDIYIHGEFRPVREGPLCESMCNECTRWVRQHHKHIPRTD